MDLDDVKVKLMSFVFVWVFYVLFVVIFVVSCVSVDFKVLLLGIKVFFSYILGETGISIVIELFYLFGGILVFVVLIVVFI